MDAPTTLASARRLLARAGLTAHPTPRLVALLAALGWVFVILVIARCRYGSDVRALLVAGEHRTLPSAFATVPTAGPAGYDGVMYAALATDPLLRRLDTPGYLDTPWYRATRMLVPLAAWTLALGQAPAAIVLYQVLCWGLGIGAVFLLARWLADERRSAWWALAAAGGAGIAAAVIRSTPDAAALCFMLAALWLHGRGASLAALGWAVVAVLTRETSLLAAFAIAADEARHRRPAWAAAFAAAPVAAYVGWQLYLKAVLGRAFETAGGNFSLPFAWLPHKLAVAFQGGIWWEEVFGTLAVLATAFALVAVVSRPADWRAAELAFLAFAGLGLVLSYNIYTETWAYARALVAVPFLAAVIAPRQRGRWRRSTLYAIVVLYLLAGATVTRSEVRLALAGRPVIRALWQGTESPPRLVGAHGVSPEPRPGLLAQPPLWVVPVASVKGRAEAVWKTRLEIANPHARTAHVTLELYSAGADPEAGTSLDIAPRQVVAWSDAMAELFDRTGTGVVKVAADGGGLRVRSLTANVAVGGPTAALLPPLTEDQVVRRDGRAVFEGLVADPDRGSAVRTNVGVFNMAGVPITVRIEVFDQGGHRLGRIDGKLQPKVFTQIDDIFGRFRALRLDDGRAEVTTLTRGGAFLAYASVIRGAGAPAEYRFPSLPRIGAATR